jgi:hypothetical protein
VEEGGVGGEGGREGMNSEKSPAVLVLLLALKIPLSP